MQLVSVITVNYNNVSVTEALLQSIIHKNTYSAIEVIVIDNGSKENKTEEWKTLYPRYCFIRSEKNLGFAGGNNLGISYAKGDYIFLVNNDTEFTEGLIETLVKRMNENPGIGALSPKIHYFDQPGMLQYAGYTPVNYFTGRNSCIGQYEMDNGQYDNVTGPTGYAHGAAMMVRKEAMDKAGLMAENYFLYYEELDWCERIKKAGYSIEVDMQALIYHKESVSVGKNTPLKEFFMNRNRILFIRKNASIPVFLAFITYFMLVVMPRNMMKYIREKQWGFIPVFWRAVWWNCTHNRNSPDLGYKLNK